MDHTVVDSEFLKPMVTGWVAKLEHAAEKRKEWRNNADECALFYHNSARAMWDPKYQKKFWSNANLPRFRITINKAFEMVAIFGPNLFWEIPHRTVEPKRQLDIPPDLFQDQMLYQQLMSMQARDETRDKTMSYLLDRWLNYTPREQPGGGLGGHSKRCILDALLTGMGVTATRPYKMPGSGRTLTGSFRVSPYDLFIDPDFETLDESRWIAIRHCDVHSEVEQRFGLPKNSLKNRSSLESSWQHGEMSTDPQAGAHRKDGKTNDLVVWYEIYSKAGIGVTNTTMDPTIREHMDQTVGQYAYIALCADVPYPLNLPSEKVRRGASDEEVKEAFAWPIPVWADDRWPVDILGFYEDPKSPYPIAPLSPGMGELKLLNFLVSWFASRTWNSTRDFWAVAGPQVEHYRQYLENGQDQSIIPVHIGAGSIKEAIEHLTQPESRQDLGKLISLVSDMFDKRVGLTPTAYGQNEDGTQNRTAEETIAKGRAVMARPEYMQKQVVEWQSRIAAAEAFCARWFVTAEDVAPFLGPAGAYLWREVVESSQIEDVVRQFSFTVSAASIRRPNRERDIGNFQTVMGQFAPVFAAHGQNTGDYGAFNGMVEDWGKLHDMNVEAMLIHPPEPDPEQQAMEQQAQQLEMQKGVADIEKTQAETQLKTVEAELKPLEFQAQVQADAQQLQMDAVRAEQDRTIELAKSVQSLQADAEKSRQQLEQDRSKFVQERMQDAQKHDQDFEQDEETHAQQVRHAEAEAQQKLETERQMASVKAEAAKKQAAAQPKDSGGDQ